MKSLHGPSMRASILSHPPITLSNLTFDDYLRVPKFTGITSSASLTRLISVFLCLIALVARSLATVRELVPGTNITGAHGDFFAGLGTRGLLGSRVASGDLDGDFSDEIVASDRESIEIIFGGYYLLSQSISLKTPSFGLRRATINTPGFISDLQIADMDGDGKQELIFSNGASIYIIRGDRIVPGTTASPSQFSGAGTSSVSCGSGSAQFGRSLAILDWNRDGFPDIAMGSRSGVSILDGSALVPSGTIPLAGHVLASFSVGVVQSLAVGDVDGNGGYDLVAGCPDNLQTNDWQPNYGQTFIFLNGRPNNTSVISGIGSLRNCGKSVACGDANNDGRAEVLIGAPWGGYCGFLYGSSNIPASMSITELTELLSNETIGDTVGVMDLDGDGAADFVFGEPEASTAPPQQHTNFTGAVYINYGGAGGAYTLTSGVALTNYGGDGKFAVGRVFGNELPQLLVGSPYAIGIGGDEGEVDIRVLQPRSLAGSAIYHAWTIPGDGAGPGIVPATRMPEFCTAKIDYSDQDFGHGSIGTIFNASLETIEQFRNVSGVVPPAGNASSLVGRYWKLSTTRLDWVSATVTFEYPELVGATPEQLRKLLRIYQADSPAGPWKVIYNTNVNTDSRQISGATTRLGYFALSTALDPLCLEYFEDFSSVAPGSSFALIGMDTINNPNTTGATHPYWEVSSDASIRSYGNSLPNFLGVNFPSFTSVIGTTPAGNKYACSGRDPTLNKNDWLFTKSIPIKGGIDYTVEFDLEAPVGSVPSTSGSDIQVYLVQVLNGNTTFIPLYQISNLKGKVHPQNTFSFSQDTTLLIGFRDLSQANTSVLTIIDNIVLRKAIYPGSQPPSITLLPVSLGVTPGSTLPPTPFVQIRDSDDSLDRVQLSIGVAPLGVSINLTPGIDGVISLTATATASAQPGVYPLTVMTWDACGAMSSAQVFLTIYVDTYLLWASNIFPPETFSQPANSSWSKESDPDLDGLTNFTEYALGSNPLSGNQSALIELGYASIQQPAHRTIKFRRRRSTTPSLQYLIMVSDDLINWQALPPTWALSSIDVGNGFDEITLTAPNANVDESSIRELFKLNITESTP